MTIDISDLRRLINSDETLITLHAEERIRQNGMSQHDVIACVLCGEIIEHYPHDISPSCLILGAAGKGGRLIHVCACIKRGKCAVITAYEPDSSEWEADLRTRRK